MNAASPNTNQLTHRVASEIHRVLAASRMTVSTLAAQIAESAAFLRRVLVGEDGLGKLIHLELLQAIANATGRTIYLKISPQPTAKRQSAVKTEGDS